MRVGALKVKFKLKTAICEESELWAELGLGWFFDASVLAVWVYLVD